MKSGVTEGTEVEVGAEVRAEFPFVHHADGGGSLGLHHLHHVQ